MPLAKPTPRKMSTASRVAVVAASQNQTGSVSSPKSYDPAFPLFDIPVNSKVLVYIPKHPNAVYKDVDENGNEVTLLGEDGQPIPREYMDKFRTHTIKEGKMFRKVKCIAGISSSELGWDGSCPYCNALSDCYDLSNIQISELFKSRGYEPNSEDGKEALKGEIADTYKEMVVQKSNGEYTFPIVVVDTEEGSMKVKVDENGNVHGTPYFYSVSESAFEKWRGALDALIDNGQAEEGAEIWGWWAILNYTYTVKEGQQPTKMDSARNLKVSFSKREGMEQVEEYFDKLTEEWDALKAQEVLVANNAMHTIDELTADADKVMQETHQRLRMYEVNKAAGGIEMNNPVAGSISQAANVLENFGGTAIPDNSAQTPAEPVANPAPQVEAPAAPAAGGEPPVLSAGPGVSNIE